MANDTTPRALADLDRIDLHEPREVTYWTQRLRRSKDELAAAVEAVGPMAHAVEAYLGTRPRKSA